MSIEHGLEPYDECADAQATDYDVGYYEGQHDAMRGIHYKADEIEKSYAPPSPYSMGYDAGYKAGFDG